MQSIGNVLQGSGPLGVGPEQGAEAGGRGKRRDAGDGDAGDGDMGRGRKDNAPEREMLTRAQTQIHRDMRAGWRLTDSQPHLGERPPALFRSTSQPHP